MKLILRNINLAKKRLCLELSGSVAPNAEGPYEYFRLCKTLDYKTIYLIAGDAPKSLTGNITVAAGREEVIVITIDEEEWASMDDCRTCECHLFKQGIAGDDSESIYEYQVILQDINKASTHMDHIALLIGHSHLLDPPTLTELRLCLHELSMNTLEHGIFQDAAPAVNLNIRLKKGGIKISYMDNAGPFVISLSSSLDIKEHIDSGKKRGLGLHILNRIAKNLTYHRYGDWNVTVLELSRRDDHTLGNRRKVMQEFSITTFPCEMEATEVIQPSGSIDSSATKTLEAYFNNLMKKGCRLIVLDLSKTEFISSAGIGIILGTVGIIRENGGDLIFMSVPPQIGKIFDVLNIRSYFTTIENLNELRDVNIPQDNG